MPTVLGRVNPVLSFSLGRDLLTAALEVNNAGISRGFNIADGTYHDNALTLRINLLAAFIMTKECLPGMVANNHGHILNISSMSAFIPPAGLADYSASKAGLIAFHEVQELFVPIFFDTQTKEYVLGVGARTQLPL